MRFNTVLQFPSLKLFHWASKLQSFVVKNVYADHNKSAPVQRVLSKLIGDRSSGVILNIGSGDTKLHPNIVNLDLKDGPYVDIVASANEIPYPDSSVDLVISQEVLEHVPEPNAVLSEIHRILRLDGILYLQVPWIIGYHGCPKDYWRFSSDGVKQVVIANGFIIQRFGSTVGPFTGFYRIAVEAFAILGSCFSRILYKPSKLIAAIFLCPLKFLDIFSFRTSEAHRLAGGFYVVAVRGGQEGEYL